MGSNPTSSANFQNPDFGRLLPLPRRQAGRPAVGGTRIGFERAFWRKRKGFIKEGQKKFFQNLCEKKYRERATGQANYGGFSSPPQAAENRPS